MMHLVDTNVLVRFLVKDNLPQFEQSKKWFKEAETGKRKLYISVVVIAEASYVLESVYKRNRVDIARVLEAFLEHTWFEVENREVLLSLWDDYTSGLHFVDSYLLAWSKINECCILTFDQQLSKHITHLT